MSSSPPRMPRAVLLTVAWGACILLVLTGPPGASAAERTVLCETFTNRY